MCNLATYFFYIKVTDSQYWFIPCNAFTASHNNNFLALFPTKIESEVVTNSSILVFTFKIRLATPDVSPYSVLLPFKTHHCPPKHNYRTKHIPLPVEITNTFKISFKHVLTHPLSHLLLTRYLNHGILDWTIKYIVFAHSIETTTAEIVVLRKR